MTSVHQAIKVDLELTLDTVVGEQRHRQVGEDEWTSEPMTLLDAIIQVAAERVVAQVDSAARERHGYGYSSILTSKIEPEIDRRVGAIVDGLMAKTLQRTDTLGRPKGEPTSLEDLVLERAEAWLNAHDRDSYSNSRQGTRLEKALASLIDREMQKALDQTMANAKQQALARLAPVAQESISKAVAEALGQQVAGAR